MSTPVGPRSCKLLTALVRVGRLLGEQIDADPDVLAADDVWDELHRLRDEIDAAERAALPIREAGLQAARACPDDQRRGTKVRLELDLVHDVEPDELVAVLLARVEKMLDEDDVDLGDVSTSWEPSALGAPVQ